MVKKIAKFLGYLVFFIAMIFYFLPKVSLYHLAEVQLKHFGVVISNENVTDNGFSFDISNADIYLKNIKTASILDMELSSYIVYNSISLENIKLAKAVKSFAPRDIKNINISYTVFNPLNISINGAGGFGEFSASISLVKHKIHLDLTPSKLMQKEYRSTLRNFKKSKDGGYIYEKTI